jgi:hypothetical protein
MLTVTLAAAHVKRVKDVILASSSPSSPKVPITRSAQPYLLTREEQEPNPDSLENVNCNPILLILT